VRELAIEAIAAGKEPPTLYKIDNLVLLSPDIDIDIASQQYHQLPVRPGPGHPVARGKTAAHAEGPIDHLCVA
jgi:esterase/lipase superfamily enzyme